MENTASRKDARERLHRRALSQASTASSTMHSPKTTKSTSTSSSHPRAITPSNPPHMHRYHHAQCDRETLGIRQPGRLSRESSSESKQLLTAASTLLQERLQQERKAESERLASKWGSDLSSSTGDIRDRDVLNSLSTRSRHGDERRPRSSHDDDSSQTSMGAKQVEKAVSTLHKQNFDLKLELFHRREKQSALEARVEELVAERVELTDIQEKLLSELVKRDKAIEEAVNMIVKLEARVDELIQEKEVASRVGPDGSYRHSWSNLSDSLRTETPKPDSGALLSTESKTLERMPSFLSDRSGHTQHLRSVVLQNHSSAMHLRKVSEVSASSEVSELNRIASPSLSMLSESSFVSIYGSKQGQDGLDLPPLRDFSGMDGTFGTRSPTPTKRIMKSPLSSQKTTSSTRRSSLGPGIPSGLSGEVGSVNSVLHMTSHLHRMERPDQQTTFSDDRFRPATTSRAKAVVTPTPQFVRPSSRAGGKRERREALQKVITNYPTHKELANTHVLPPTPDTVSSSVLRKHKGQSSSQDSLPRSDDAHTPRVVPALLPRGADQLRSFEIQESRSRSNTQPTRLSAPPRTRSELPATSFAKLDDKSEWGYLAHSAATATTGVRLRSDSFISDSDSEGGADARSEAETYDYWMRESYKPDGEDTHSGSRPNNRRSPSPDLFSFPVSTQGWEPEAMFGALKGGGFLGSPAPALKRDPVDEIASSLQAAQPDPIQPTADAPEAPSRRASLNAQVASRFLLSTLTGKTGRSSSRDDGSVARADARGRSNSVDGGGNMATVGAREDTGPTTKRSQYPPISGLQSRGRNLGLNSLFRRSGSESYGAPSSATESNFPSSVTQRPPPAPPVQSRYLKKPSGRNSVPPPATMPWTTTRPINMVEDELASATPPPILRNRPAPLQTDLISSDAMITPDTSESTEAGAVPATPITEIRSTTPVAPPSGGGGVRKWLGFGRKASSMTRAN
ncbi:hypothetical protein F5B22DRAFT_203974 [Xylaria bambusicola]|uniref:uncharacterized protein n=1 Tax=Xylaria bambusicola TaxID=326684 RepID=UPI0020075410|nr:uncharacterized protein F5B22DRAFT_203974 [Xylaria bambusicola]KAI0515149.1 hypothetical protein F5B22DRAFT_203974 [Xylaria bambusicola]